MVRSARAEDREVCIELAIAFNTSTSYRSLLATRERFGEIFDAVTGIGQEAEPLGTILVGEVEGQVVGMVAAILVPHFLTGEPYVDELAWWVSPPFRSGTLGPRILRALERWAVQNGATMIRMVAPCGSTVGDYYRRCGYEEVETTFFKGLTDGRRDARDAGVDRPDRRGNGAPDPQEEQAG